MAPDEFVRRLMAEDVLQFGSFVLKSGRRSPYFFNLGAIDRGGAFQWLGSAYADLATGLPEQPEVLFGPAYKGIPIAVATALALAREHGRDVGVAFDRKEAKAHGEGGQLIGSPLAGRRVAIVDDIVTDGGAKRGAFEAITAVGGRVVGVLIALDRRELTGAGETAVQTLEREFQAPVRSVANLDDVVSFLRASGQRQPAVQAMQAYRQRYCAQGP